MSMRHKTQGMHHCCSTISPCGWRCIYCHQCDGPAIVLLLFLLPSTSVPPSPFFELFLCTVVALLLLQNKNDDDTASTVPIPLVIFPTIHVVGWLLLLLPSRRCSFSSCRRHCWLPVVVVIDVVVVNVVLHWIANRCGSTLLHFVVSTAANASDMVRLITILYSCHHYHCLLCIGTSSITRHLILLLLLMMMMI